MKRNGFPLRSPVRWMALSPLLGCLVLLLSSHSALVLAQDTAAQESGADAGNDSKSDPKMDDQVVALVDGRKILRSDVDRRVVGRYGRELTDVPAEQKIEMILEYEKVSLEELIDRAAMANLAESDPRYKVGEAEIDQRMELVHRQLPAGTNLDIALDQLGLTEASLREEIRLELAINRLIEATMAAAPAPTEAEVRKYYEESPEFFTKREKVNVRHILVSTEGIDDKALLAEKKAQAEQLRSRVLDASAEEFSVIAKEYSDCQSKQQGGRLGEFGRGDMVEEFEQAAFSQELGEVGPLVKTGFGYHIIIVDARQEAGVVPFEEVAETLPDYLARQRRQEALENLVKELREKAKIERNL